MTAPLEGIKMVDVTHGPVYGAAASVADVAADRQVWENEFPPIACPRGGYLKPMIENLKKKGGPYALVRHTA